MAQCLTGEHMEANPFGTLSVNTLAGFVTPRRAGPREREGLPVETVPR